MKSFPVSLYQLRFDKKPLLVDYMLSLIIPHTVMLRCITCGQGHGFKWGKLFIVTCLAGSYNHTVLWEYVQSDVNLKQLTFVVEVTQCSTQPTRVQKPRLIPRKTRRVFFLLVNPPKKSQQKTHPKFNLVSFHVLLITKDFIMFKAFNCMSSEFAKYNLLHILNELSNSFSKFSFQFHFSVIIFFTHCTLK